MPTRKLPKPKRDDQKEANKADPIKALDAIRAKFKAFDQKKQEFIRNELGEMAKLNKRVTADEQTWGRFTKNRFWEKCEGEKPTMGDRSDSLRFVTRFAENAKSRGAAKNASKHAIVVAFLLNEGFEPDDIPAELAKPGKGINATYITATQGQAANTAKGSASAKPAAHKGDARTVDKTQPTDDGWDDDDGVDSRGEDEQEEEVEKADSWGDDEEEEVEDEQLSSSLQKANTSGFMSLELKGKKEIIKEAKSHLKRKGVYLYVEKRTDKSGKEFPELLEVITDLPKAARGPERRKKDLRSSKATSRRPPHGSRSPRRSA